MGLKKYLAGSGKKREFSDNSTNDDNPKKQWEGSLNDSENVDGIFRKGLYSPDSVEIYVNCIKESN